MEYAKILLIPLLILLASCGASHKLKTSQKKTVDSAVTITQDTMHISHELTRSSNITAQDVHIRVEYGDSTLLAYMLRQPGQTLSQDTANIGSIGAPSWAGTQIVSKLTKTGNKVIDAIQDAISAAGSAGRIPSSIQIDIGSISDSSTLRIKKDSAGGHSTSVADLHKTEESKSKEVTHTGLPLGLKIGAAVLLLIILAVALWRLYQKFKP